jgi:hypothetical protein
MGLFDEPESEAAAAADATGFDEESKIRLFETQERESAGGHDYLKKFLPVIALAIIIIGGVIYLMQPGVGSAVKPPKPVEDSVYDYMRSKEHRSVREITFYNCDGWYWVKILADPRGTESVDDPSNEYRLRVDRNGEEAGNIQTLSLPDKENDTPCK